MFRAFGCNACCDSENAGDAIVRVERGKPATTPRQQVAGRAIPPSAPPAEALPREGTDEDAAWLRARARDDRPPPVYEESGAAGWVPPPPPPESAPPPAAEPAPAAASVEKEESGEMGWAPPPPPESALPPPESAPAATNVMEASSNGPSAVVLQRMAAPEEDVQDFEPAAVPETAPDFEPAAVPERAPDVRDFEPAAAPERAPEPRTDYFHCEITRQSTLEKLGVDIITKKRPPTLKVRVIKDGIIQRWNEEHPDQAIMVNDTIIEVNGCNESLEDMFSLLANELVLNLRIQRSRDFP